MNSKGMTFAAAPRTPNDHWPKTPPPSCSDFSFTLHWSRPLQDPRQGARVRGAEWSSGSGWAGKGASDCRGRSARVAARQWRGSGGRAGAGGNGVEWVEVEAEGSRRPGPSQDE